MRRSSLLVAVLSMAFLAYSGVSASAAPKIELEDRVFDFQEMIEGQTVEHDYQVKNRGDQPLEIQRIKPG